MPLPSSVPSAQSLPKRVKDPLQTNMATKKKGRSNRTKERILNKSCYLASRPSLVCIHENEQTQNEWKNEQIKSDFKEKKKILKAHENNCHRPQGYFLIPWIEKHFTEKLWKKIIIFSSNKHCFVALIRYVRLADVCPRETMCLRTNKTNCVANQKGTYR